MRIRIKTIFDATKLVKICSRYKEKIDLHSGRYIVNAKSIMGVASVCNGEISHVQIITDDLSRKSMFEYNIRTSGLSVEAM